MGDFKRKGAWAVGGDGRYMLMLELDPPQLWRVHPSLRELVTWCDQNNVELINREQADEVFASEASAP